MLKARAEFFECDLSASTLVEASKLVDPRYRVEIEATVVLGCGDAQAKPATESNIYAPENEK